MGLTPEIDELVSAWVLDGLGPDEAAEVEKLIATDPDVAVRAAELREVVALLGESTAEPPPPHVRAALLRAAEDSTPTPAEQAEPLTLLSKQIEALADVVGGLDQTDWLRQATPYQWSVHGLMAHLLVIERYTARRLGLLGGAEAHDESEPVDHLGMGAAAIEAEQARPPAATFGSWLERARSTVASLTSGNGPTLDGLVQFHGYPFTVESLVIARAFEIWTHADDIRRAIGRGMEHPSASDLRAMSSLSVRSLPLTLPIVRPEALLGAARIVLTGDGGGTFDIGDSGERDVLVVADVVDYCRLAARRLTVEELDPIVEGDRRVADDLLAAAQAFAV